MIESESGWVGPDGRVETVRMGREAALASAAEAQARLRSWLRDFGAACQLPFAQDVAAVLGEAAEAGRLRAELDAARQLIAVQNVLLVRRAEG